MGNETACSNRTEGPRQRREQATKVCRAWEVMASQKSKGRMLFKHRGSLRNVAQTLNNMSQKERHRRVFQKKG